MNPNDEIALEAFWEQMERAAGGVMLGTHTEASEEQEAANEDS